MPNGNGGSLSASTYNDLVALILKSNNFPAGTTELTPDSISTVQIIPKDGPGELPTNVLARVVGCLAKSGSDWVLTNATAPVRVERTGVGPEDATRPLGNRTTTLKFVLTRLDAYVGPADVGERPADWRGWGGWPQRDHGQPRRRDLPLAC